MNFLSNENALILAFDELCINFEINYDIKKSMVEMVEIIKILSTVFNDKIFDDFKNIIESTKQLEDTKTINQDNTYILGVLINVIILIFYEKQEDGLYVFGIINAYKGVEFQGYSENYCNGIITINNVSFDQITSFFEKYEKFIADDKNEYVVFYLILENVFDINCFYTDNKVNKIRINMPMHNKSSFLNLFSIIAYLYYKENNDTYFDKYNEFYKKSKYAIKKEFLTTIEILETIDIYYFNILHYLQYDFKHKITLKEDMDNILICMMDIDVIDETNNQFKQAQFALYSEVNHIFSRFTKEGSVQAKCKLIMNKIYKNNMDMLKQILISKDDILIITVECIYKSLINDIPTLFNVYILFFGIFEISLDKEFINTDARKVISNNLIQCIALFKKTPKKIQEIQIFLLLCAIYIKINYIDVDEKYVNYKFTENNNNYDFVSDQNILQILCDIFSNIIVEKAKHLKYINYLFLLIGSNCCDEHFLFVNNSNNITITFKGIYYKKDSNNKKLNIIHTMYKNMIETNKCIINNTFESMILSNLNAFKIGHRNIDFHSNININYKNNTITMDTIIEPCLNYSINENYKIFFEELIKNKLLYDTKINLNLYVAYFNIVSFYYENFSEYLNEINYIKYNSTNIKNFSKSYTNISEENYHYFLKTNQEIYDKKTITFNYSDIFVTNNMSYISYDYEYTYIQFNDTVNNFKYNQILYLNDLEFVILTYSRFRIVYVFDKNKKKEQIQTLQILITIMKTHSIFTNKEKNDSYSSDDSDSFDDSANDKKVGELQNEKIIDETKKKMLITYLLNYLIIKKYVIDTNNVTQPYIFINDNNEKIIFTNIDDMKYFFNDEEYNVSLQPDLNGMNNIQNKLFNYLEGFLIYGKNDVYYLKMANYDIVFELYEDKIMYGIYTLNLNFSKNTSFLNGIFELQINNITVKLLCLYNKTFINNVKNKSKKKIINYYNNYYYTVLNIFNEKPIFKNYKDVLCILLNCLYYNNPIIIFENILNIYNIIYNDINHDESILSNLMLNVKTIYYIPLNILLSKDCDKKYTYKKYTYEYLNIFLKYIKSNLIIKYDEIQEKYMYISFKEYDKKNILDLNGIPVIREIDLTKNFIDNKLDKNTYYFSTCDILDEKDIYNEFKKLLNINIVDLNETILDKNILISINLFNYLILKKKRYLKSIKELIMGSGKSSSITPYICLSLIQYLKKKKVKNDIIYIVMPSHLINQSFETIMSNLCPIIDYFELIIYSNKKKIQNDNISEVTKLYLISDSDFKYFMIEKNKTYKKYIYVIYDEVDLMADPLTCELNLIKDKKIELKNEIIIHFLSFVLYESIFKNKLFWDKLKDLCEYNGYHYYLIRHHLDDNMYNYIYDFFKNEIINKQNDFFNDNANELIYNYFKKNILFFILENQYNLNYGLPENYNKIDLRNNNNYIYKAIPYISGDNPAYGSEFSDPILTYTLSYFCFNLKQTNQRLIDKQYMLQYYVNELTITKIKSEQEYIFQKIKNLFNYSDTENMTSGDFMKHKKLYIKNIINQVNNEDYQKFFLNKIALNLKYVYDCLNISFNELLLMKNIENFVSFTGTAYITPPVNYDENNNYIYYCDSNIDNENGKKCTIDYSRNDENLTVNEIILKIINDAEKLKKVKTNITDNIMDEIIKNIEPYDVLIDLGAFFINWNDEIIYKKYCENENKKKYFVFFDNGVKISDTYTGHFVEKNSIDKNKKDAFFYFGNKNITGVDADNIMNFNAHALITITNITTMRDFSQAVFRMRQINKINCQTFDLFFNNKIINPENNNIYSGGDFRELDNMRHIIIEMLQKNQNDIEEQKFKILIKQNIIGLLKNEINDNDIKKILFIDPNSEKNIHLKQTLIELMEFIHISSLDIYNYDDLTLIQSIETKKISSLNSILKNLIEIYFNINVNNNKAEINKMQEQEQEQEQEHQQEQEQEKEQVQEQEQQKSFNRPPETKINGDSLKIEISELLVLTVFDNYTHQRSEVLNKIIYFWNEKNKNNKIKPQNIILIYNSVNNVFYYFDIYGEGELCETNYYYYSFFKSINMQEIKDNLIIYIDGEIFTYSKDETLIFNFKLIKLYIKKFNNIYLTNEELDFYTQYKKDYTEYIKIFELWKLSENFIIKSILSETIQGGEYINKNYYKYAKYKKKYLQLKNIIKQK